MRKSGSRWATHDNRRRGAGHLRDIQNQRNGGLNRLGKFGCTVSSSNIHTVEKSSITFDQIESISVELTANERTTPSKPISQLSRFLAGTRGP